MNKRIILALTFLLIVCTVCVVFVACDKGGNYDIKGEASIVLTLDKVYNGVDVSCSNAVKIDKTSQTTYIIQLKNRNLVDVIVVAEGYATKVVNVKTTDFVEGVASKTVSLEKLIYTASFTVNGVSIDSVKTDVIEGIQPIDTQVNGKRIQMIFDQKPNSKIKFFGDDILEKVIAVNEQNLTNNQLEMSLLLINSNSQNVAVTINNNEGQSYINVREVFGFNNNGYRLGIGQSKTILLNKNRSYIISSDSANTPDEYIGYYLTPTDYADSSYINLNVSQIAEGRAYDKAEGVKDKIKIRFYDKDGKTVIPNTYGGSDNNLDADDVDGLGYIKLWNFATYSGDYDMSVRSSVADILSVLNFQTSIVNNVTYEFIPPDSYYLRELATYDNVDDCYKLDIPVMSILKLEVTITNYIPAEAHKNANVSDERGNYIDSHLQDNILIVKLPTDVVSINIYLLTQTDDNTKNFIYKLDITDDIFTNPAIELELELEFDSSMSYN